MKALILGIHGFIGANLKDRLVKDGFEVVGMPRQIPPDKYGEFIESEHPDWIFHLSTYGNYRSQYSEEQKTFEVNVVNFFYLLNAVKSMDFKAFVYVGTGWEYENRILDYEPVNMYIATKLCGLHLSRYFALKYNKPIVTVKPSFIYGRGQSETRFIPMVIKALREDREFTLSPYDPLIDWIYIDNFIDALIKTAKGAKKYQGLSVNISQGASLRNSEVIKILEEIYKKKLKKIIGKKEDFIPDRVVKKNDIQGRRLTLKEGLKKMLRIKENL